MIPGDAGVADAPAPVLTTGRRGRWYGRLVPNLVVIVTLLFFFAPLLALARYSLQNVPAFLLGRDTLFKNWQPGDVFKAFSDPRFWPSFWLTVRLAIGTVLLSMALLVPTAVWVHLRVPKARDAIEFMTVLPYMIPPIAMVAGIRIVQPHVRWFLDSDYSLIPFYVILALPFTYRALDAGLRAIDLKTLVDASRSLGAGWISTLTRTVVPNLRSALVSASFLTSAIVIGEFTIASLLLKPVLTEFQRIYVGREPRAGYGLNLLALLVTVLLFMLVSILTRKRDTPRRPFLSKVEQ